MTRVVVTGDRKWGPDRYGEVLSALATLDPWRDSIVLGDAPGVDALARAAAEELGFLEIVGSVTARPGTYRVHCADWGRYRHGAGPKRNEAMLDDGGDEAEVWYFHDHIERSRGTRNCCRQAQERGMTVRDGRAVA